MPLLTTTFTAPKILADSLLALTEAHPEVALDVGEYPDAASPLYESCFRYSLWLPEALQTQVGAELEALGLPTQTFCVVDESTDYVALTRANFPPLQVGPYFITRNDEPVPAGLIGLAVAPNRAFGSGEHATTEGCLLGYEHRLNEGATFTHALDFGAGSGILAFAAAKRQGTAVLAIDIDAPSVEICAENAALNGVGGLITCQVGDTPTGEGYDLVFANILLHPLLELAPQLVASLAKTPEATLILSGFTTEQGPEIIAKYTALGLRHSWQHQARGWLAHVWRWA
ncbi:MAG: 50S ribosomal protein L11 methyltransferase [Pseudomonadota bacterium]